MVTTNPASSQPRVQKQIPSFTPRRTSTNGLVISKQVPEAFLPVKAKYKKRVIEEPEVPDSETERESLRAGMEDEDDTLERQEAILSPIKGSELRSAAKVANHIF